MSEKAQRDLRHRRYVLQGAIEDVEFQLQLLEYRMAKAGEETAEYTELQEQVNDAAAKIEELNNELDSLG